jgi:hypothetical protein
MKKRTEMQKSKAHETKEVAGVIVFGCFWLGIRFRSIATTTKHNAENLAYGSVSDRTSFCVCFKNYFSR